MNSKHRSQQTEGHYMEYGFIRMLQTYIDSFKKGHIFIIKTIQLGLLGTKNCSKITPEQFCKYWWDHFISEIFFV